MKEFKFKPCDIILYKTKTKEAFVHMVVLDAFNRKDKGTTMYDDFRYKLLILCHCDSSYIGQIRNIEAHSIDKDYDLMDPQ